MKDGGHAFPNITPDMNVDGGPGMTLRDYFAGQALVGYAANARVMDRAVDDWGDGRGPRPAGGEPGPEGGGGESEGGEHFPESGGLVPGGVPVPAPPRVLAPDCVFFTALKMPMPSRQITPTAIHVVGAPAR